MNDEIQKLQEASSEEATSSYFDYCGFAIIPSLWDGGRSRKCQRRLLR
eukprot:COSAG02_NODE_4181_length_5656_cov_2.900846_8_plen_47_part_01